MLNKNWHLAFSYFSSTTQFRHPFLKEALPREKGKKEEEKKERKRKRWAGFDIRLPGLIPSAMPFTEAAWPSPGNNLTLRRFTLP